MIEALLVVLAVVGILAAIINIEYYGKIKRAYRDEYNLRLKAEEEECSILHKELTEIEHAVRLLVEEHNSWHDRKIAFYFDFEGWHCCYADEMPQGDVVSEWEKINEQNENDDENKG